MMERVGQDKTELVRTVVTETAQVPARGDGTTQLWSRVVKNAGPTSMDHLPPPSKETGYPGF